MISYTELSVRSCFSFLQAASHPEELARQSKQLGYQGMALTDLHGFYGMVRAHEACKQINLKFIVGTELHLEEGMALILLAKNMKAYKKICRLLSEAFRGQPKAQPQITLSQIEKWIHADDHHVLLPPRNFPSLQHFEWLRERYPVIQLVTKKLQADPDKKLKDWLKKIPSETHRAWTWDVYYHHPSRFELFEILQSIRENTPLSQKRPSINAESYLKPLTALEQYRVPKEWIYRTQEIAESCTFSPSEIRYRYPQEWLPKSETPQGFLRKLCREGLKERYKNKISQKILNQLEYELKLIRELEYEDYFLTVWDIVKYARSQNILCQGRGSAANSIVCYLLGITSIDPVQMNLLFERFISKERAEAPDIDVDFEHERREEVIQYIYRKYGRHRAGMVATLITYRTRSALRAVGKALEVPVKTIDELSKRSHWNEKVLSTATEDPKLKRLFRLAKQLKSFPRHLGQHTGGMIICQDRLDEISPIEPATMEGRSLVQWDKYDIEKLGLLKIDLLSLGMLTCIRKSFDLLRQHKVADLELHSIPADDKKTYDMICESRTVGVFQIESRAQMSMLPRLRPRNFYDLVVEVAIIRPGPIQGGMLHPYLRRRMGLERVAYAHPLLEPILKKTMGVPIFQEQVMKMAIDIAGYTPGEADALRRAMGAWKRTGDLSSHAKDMERRLIANGVPTEFSQKICQQILGFGEYGFPESHAASFALLTYASSYIKAHYPEFFFCALLNSMPLGFYSFHTLSSAFMREGVKILPVDLQKSNWNHQIEELPDSEGSPRGLRLGYRCVRSLNQSKAEEFIQQRKETGEINLKIFNQEERASLLILTSQDRRLGYWKALDPSRDSLKEMTKEKNESSFKSPDPLSHIVLDFEFMETTLKTHPAKLLRERYWAYSIPQSKISLSSQLLKCRQNQNVLVFGITQVVQSPPTAKGMCFITAEDETGFLNLVFTPQKFKQFKEIIQNQWAFLASGKLQKQEAYPSILVQQVIPAQPSKASVLPIKQGATERISSFLSHQEANNLKSSPPHGHPRNKSLKNRPVRLFH